MEAFLLHLAVVVAGVVLGGAIERHRTWLLSRLLFWNRRTDLVGTYATSWTTETPPISSTDGTPPQPRPKVEDLIRIKWASGTYISGTGSNSRLGDYTLSGRAQGTAMTLSYSPKDKSLGDHLGVVMLRVEAGDVFSGYWSQNRPDESSVHSGTTYWKKRPHK